MTTAQSGARTARLDGIEMHYELHGEGEPLVLLHGFTGTSGDWAHVFDLAELGRAYTVIAPDLRGHGRSTSPGAPFTIRQCALDVLALLDQLGVTRYRAVGLSFGANALLHMATQRPDRVESMVLVAATPYFPAQARALMRAFSDAPRSAEEWAEMRGRHELGDEQILALWRQPGHFAEGYDDMSFTPPYLSTITARTMIVNGDRDPFYPVELSLEMYRAIPRACLWILPDGGHGPIFGAWRAPFARAALAFLRGEQGEPAEVRA
ncbi:alpha/beta fold family hydrolase [Sorangium cellulosum]|uniref:Alpha/beta fold family hydrolase n=1 Tax=Sorangium cellulosum TaxID=56 RepID=A0A4P2PUY5_SORCE|nr:alpha/beta hydrolase [Sorangium cellulosum]AUX20517.1 alpha/beta fold family hydrolase [Sorangium cellulosum]